MKIAITLILTVFAILALFLFLMGVLGLTVGVRVGGNLFPMRASARLIPSISSCLSRRRRSGCISFGGVGDVSGKL